MESNVILSTAIVVGLVALIVALIMVKRRRRRELLAELTATQRALHEQCVAADKAVRAAERAHEQVVKKAKTELKKAETPERLATAGFGNYVTPITVCLNNRVHDLSLDVEAALDSEGDITAYATQRSTLTRIAAGAAIAGPAGAIVGGLARKNKHHKVDTRELYLMALGPDWQEVARLNPKQGDKARALMQAINVAAKNAPAAMSRHIERVSAATQEVARASADTEAIELARAAREALGEDPFEQLRTARRQRGESEPIPTTPLPGGIARFGDGKSGQGPQDVIR